MTKSPSTRSRVEPEINTDKRFDVIVIGSGPSGSMAVKELTAQAWKDLTGTSRKYSIPLAEYFDGEKVTLRVGDIRRKR